MANKAEKVYKASERQNQTSNNKKENINDHQGSWSDVELQKRCSGPVALGLFLYCMITIVRRHPWIMILENNLV